MIRCARIILDCVFLICFHIWEDPFVVVISSVTFFMVGGVSCDGDMKCGSSIKGGLWLVQLFGH